MGLFRKWNTCRCQGSNFQNVFFIFIPLYQLGIHRGWPLPKSSPPCVSPYSDNAHSIGHYHRWIPKFWGPYSLQLYFFSHKNQFHFIAHPQAHGARCSSLQPNLFRGAPSTSSTFSTASFIYWQGLRVCDALLIALYLWNQSIQLNWQKQVWS
jgi:hypothetical protein